jgi:hypothetical protein
MLPKNSKHFIHPTTEKLDVDQQLVVDLVGFYYSTLRKALSNLDCHFIQVENLGLFKAKPNELPKLIHKYEKHLSVLQPETFNQMATKKDVESKLERVLKLKEMINQDKQRKKEFLKQKYGE